MRHTNPIMSFLFVAGLTAGCASTDATAGGGPIPSGNAAVQLEKAKTETKGAAVAVQDYAFAQKAEFVEKMKKDLVGVQEEVDRLAAKVDKSDDSAKADAKSRLEVVRAKWLQAKKQLDAAESATESTWDDMKASVQTSYGELKDSFDTTRQWLSELGSHRES